MKQMIIESAESFADVLVVLGTGQEVKTLADEAWSHFDAQGEQAGKTAPTRAGWGRVGTVRIVPIDAALRTLRDRPYGRVVIDPKLVALCPALCEEIREMHTGVSARVGFFRGMKR
jgi:hypothetical protein